MTQDIENTSEDVAASFRPEARQPRGMADRRAHDLALERHIITSVSKVYESYGFEALATSGFEYADALGKFLPDADRPNVGVFALRDDDEQWMALRYDLTAPLARFAAQNWTSLPKPFRRYAFGPVWRNEKPGPGRLREFVQCDADTVGSDRPEADAELIAMAVEGFKSMGATARMRINNRKLLDGILEANAISDPAQRLSVLRTIDKLDRLGETGVTSLLGEGRKDESGALTKGAGLNFKAIDAVLNFLNTGMIAGRQNFLDHMANLTTSQTGQAALEDLSRLNAALKAMDVDDQDAMFDVSIVRGLEYYTGCVFEAELMQSFTNDKGESVSLGSVGGGGRYDDLIARFTGEPIPATGFSFGVTRLVAALSQQAQFQDMAPRGPVVIINFSETDMGAYVQLANAIRAQGMNVEIYFGRAGMKAQMKYADRRRSPAAIMIGEDELKAGTVTIKDLDQGRAMANQVEDNRAWREDRPGQITLPRDAALAHLRKILDN